MGFSKKFLFGLFDGVALSVFCLLFGAASAHHDFHEGEPWRFYHHGIYRTFFSGFFSTLLLIMGVLVFYYYCLRGGSLGRLFPIFPKKPIIPITIPFARAPNFLETDRPETLVLTSATTPQSVFYSNVHAPLNDVNGGKSGFSGYNIV